LVYLFKVGRTSPHFALQLLLGIVIFTFFQEATATAMNSVAGTGHLIRKAYFPRAILVVSASLSALITFAINLCLVTAVGALLGQMQLGWASLLAPLFLVELYAIVFGLSLLLSALFVFYRDLGHIWEIVSQLILYGSAVIYPFSLVSNGHRVLGFLVGVNPIAQIIEDMRHALVAGNLPYPPDSGLHGVAVPWMVSYLGPGLYLIPLVVVVAILALGTVVFRRLSPRFAENL
jgi:ABC-2 type transport system permease protein